jgi:hypothetical protein
MNIEDRKLPMVDKTKIQKSKYFITKKKASQKQDQTQTLKRRRVKTPRK